MNKRILSFLLAAIMLLTVIMTGCSSSKTEEEATEDVTDEASSSTMTLVMYVVSENEVSEDTAKQVNDAFNKITKSKFKTQVILKFVTEDKYFETIEGVVEANAAHEALAEEAEKALKDARKKAKAQGIATDTQWFDDFYAQHPEYAEFRETEELTGDDTTAEETVLVTIEGADGYTMSEIKYPDAKDNQMDIIWIDSYDRYMEYIENEWLSRLDDELSSSSKKLKEYISPSLLAWAKWAGKGTYAIPNNGVIGEYTYLLLNKELVDKYNYDPEALNTITKCSDFLADVAKYEKDYQPIVGDLPLTNVFYWNYDDVNMKINFDTFCLLGNTYNTEKQLDPSSNGNSFIGAKNIFTLGDYTNQLRSIREYKDLGYISEDTTKKYAMRVVKGGAELQKVYGDEYYMNVLENPRINEDTVFGSMFGVTTFTRSVSRSMEIITYLNTNSDLRNVLQYGVENVNYKLNVDGVVERLNQDYMMDIAKTGNAFVAYPEEGSDPEIWKYGKLQNLDAKSGLINCFRVTEENITAKEGSEDLPLDVNELINIRDQSVAIYESVMNAQSLAELDELIAKYSTTLSSAIKNQSSMTKTQSIYNVYYNWLLDNGLYVNVEG